MLECNKLKQVDSFKYLGDWVLEKMKGTRESELDKPVVLNTPPQKKPSENNFLSIHSGKYAALQC